MTSRKRQSSRAGPSSRVLDFGRASRRVSGTEEKGPKLSSVSIQRNALNARNPRPLRTFLRQWRKRPNGQNARIEMFGVYSCAALDGNQASFAQHNPTVQPGGWCLVSAVNQLPFADWRRRARYRRQQQFLTEFLGLQSPCGGRTSGQIDRDPPKIHHQYTTTIKLR